MLDETKTKLDKVLAETTTLEAEEELRRRIRQGGIYKPEHAAYLSAELERRERLRSSASNSEMIEINRSLAAAARDAASAAEDANRLARQANQHADSANKISKIAVVIAIIAIIASAFVAFLDHS